MKVRIPLTPELEPLCDAGFPAFAYCELVEQGESLLALRDREGLAKVGHKLLFQIVRLALTDEYPAVRRAVEIMNEFLASRVELLIINVQCALDNVPDGKQWLSFLRDGNAEVFGYDARVEGGVREDFAPAEEVHPEPFGLFVPFIDLTNMILQLDIIRCGRQHPEILKLRCEREGFRYFGIYLRLRERFHWPDRLLLTLQAGPPPARTTDYVHAFLTLARTAMPDESRIRPQCCERVGAKLLKLLPGLGRRKIKMNKGIHPASMYQDEWTIQVTGAAHSRKLRISL